MVWQNRRSRTTWRFYLSKETSFIVLLLPVTKIRGFVKWHIEMKRHVSLNSKRIIYTRVGKPFILRWPHWKLSLVTWPQNSALGKLLRPKSRLDLFPTAIRATICLLNISVFQKKKTSSSLDRWQQTEYHHTQWMPKEKYPKTHW